MNISDFTDLDYQYIYHELSEEEGVRTHVYNDTVGVRTVGVGHNLLESVDHIIGHSFTGTLTMEEVELVFRQDLLRTLKALNDGLYPLKQFPEHVQYVLTSLCFNLGWNGLSKFMHFIAAIKAKDYGTACKELKDSKWYHQVGPRGIKLTNLLLAS